MSDSSGLRGRFCFFVHGRGWTIQSADLRSDVFVTWADFSGNFHLSVCIIAAGVPIMQAHRDQHRLRCTRAHRLCWKDLAGDLLLGLSTNMGENPGPQPPHLTEFPGPSPTVQLAGEVPQTADSQLSGLVRTRHSERSFPVIRAEHSDRRVSTTTIMKFHPIVNGS